MGLTYASDLVNKSASKLSSAANIVGVVSLAVMMFLTAVDVTGRYVFNRPVTGAYEITAFLMVFLAFLSTAYTQVKKGHVAVDLLVTRLSPGFQSLCNSITTLISFALFPLVSWQSFVRAFRLAEQGTTDGTLGISLAPFVFMVGIGTGILSLVLLGHFLGHLSANVGHSRESIMRLAVSLACVAGLAAFFVWSQDIPEVSPLQAGVIGFAFMFLLMFMGMPVAFAMMTVGFIGLAYLRNINGALATLGEKPYGTAANYAFCIIPLFMLMGYLVYYAGLGRDLYEAAYKWVGQLKGGLAQATVAACAGFGAIVGTTTAGVITFGTIALPEMERYKYDQKLSTGCIAAAGGLGAMIPPSNGFIMWGILTDTPIGDLFIAGILPGIMIAIMFMAMIYLRCSFNPRLGPPGPRTATREKLASLKAVWPIVVLFGLVIGGLYAGIFTPTEAGGIGAFGAFVISLAMRRLNFGTFKSALLDSARVSAMVFMILTGGYVFGRFLAASQLPMALSEFITGFHVTPLVTLAAILVMWIVLGCVMPGLPTVILTVPILLPIFHALDFNLIWLGVLHVVVAEMGVITPPVGINAYVMAGVARDIPMSVIFRGIWPFFYVLCVAMVILIFVPQIALLLPGALD